jgi:predicted nucleic acid-binding protein
MIAIDTNLLIYAHRAEIWSHDTAFVRIPGLAVIDPLA